MKFRSVGTSVEPDESPCGVDGRLPASAWVEVLAKTWKVGFGGWGVNCKPL